MTISDIKLNYILSNERVVALYVEADEQMALKFLLSSGVEIIIEAEGDCCSETWFADITGVHVLLNYQIRAIEEIDLPEPTDERSRQDCDEAYGLKITTWLGGVCDIVYRNSSNGYYGGGYYHVWPGTERWNELQAMRWEQITDDWTEADKRAK